MRVTQSMLSNNLLRNLSTSYSKMAAIQNQINSGKKVTRPSENPVVAIRGMSGRTDLNKVEQFSRNLTEVEAWLDNSDTALSETGDAIHRVRELVTQAANGTYTPDDLKKLQIEIDQIRMHIEDLANSKVGDKYIFSSTNTQNPLYTNVEYYDHDAIQAHYDKLKTNYDNKKVYENSTDEDLKKEFEDAKKAYDDFFDAIGNIQTSKEYLDANNIPTKIAKNVLNAEYQDRNGNIINPFDSFKILELVTEPGVSTSVNLYTNPPNPGVNSGKSAVQMEVFDGIQVQVNTDGLSVFHQTSELFKRISIAIDEANETGDATKLTEFLGNEDSFGNTNLSGVLGLVLDARADVGARQNRVEMMRNRIEIQEINVKKLVSENEDIEYEEAITEMITQESIHRAALSVGARIIQPTLTDFLR